MIRIFTNIQTSRRVPSATTVRAAVRNTGILPVRPTGFQPAGIRLRRLEARGPHSLEGCVPAARHCTGRFDFFRKMV